MDTELERIAKGTKTIGDTFITPPTTPEVKATTSEWLEQFDPKTSARYKGVLDKQRMINRQSNTQAKYVEESVANGAIVTTRPNGRRVLQHPDGRFLYESDLSKVALDYAVAIAKEVVSAPILPNIRYHQYIIANTWTLRRPAQVNRRWPQWQLENMSATYQIKGGIMDVKLEAKDTPMGKFQKERTDAISEMFDNVDERGIYPTTKLFARLDNCVKELLRQPASS